MPHLGDVSTYQPPLQPPQANTSHPVIMAAWPDVSTAVPPPSDSASEGGIAADNSYGGVA